MSYESAEVCRVILTRVYSKRLYNTIRDIINLILESKKIRLLRDAKRCLGFLIYRNEFGVSHPGCFPFQTRHFSLVHHVFSVCGVLIFSVFTEAVRDTGKTLIDL